MITDRLYHKGAYDSLQFQSKLAPTYFYYFRFVIIEEASSLEKVGALNSVESTDPKNDFLGVSHGDDVFLIYFNPNSASPKNSYSNQSDKAIVGNDLINLYYNFANNSLAAFDNLKISNVKPNQVNCLEIFSPQNFSLVLKDEKFGNGEFWDRLNIIE